jgi:hypothetical protein
MISPIFSDICDCRLFPDEARVAIYEVCASTEPEIRLLLPTLPQSIELAVQTGTSVIPETGEVGMAEAIGRVRWTVDPSRPGGVVDITRTQLRFTLFHELHHMVRGWVVNGDYPLTSFMDAVVSEGLATVFERDFAGRRPPWGEYPEDVSEWVAELLSLPVSAPIAHWMYQHPDGRRWIGYRAGTYIVDRATAASGRSAAELVLTTTNEILRIAELC